MNEQEANMAAIVSLYCDDLTDLELAAINTAAQLGMDPRHVIGYEKAKSLFTERDGIQMHDATKDALARVVLQRLGGQV